jgi:type I restriction enzyme S subunit
MSNWQSVCIGDIANIPKKRPVANPQAIELLTVRLYAKGIERTGKYPRATERGRPYFVREAGEILIGRQNFHNGGIGIVGKADHGLICSNAITSLIPTNRADKDFLFYLLSNSEFRNSIQKQSEGTGQSEISETKILSLELALPPLPEQKKIAEILSGIDKAINKILEAIAKSETTLTGVFANLDLIASSGKTANLGEVASVQNGYAFQSSIFSEDPLGIPLIRISNISGGLVDASKSKRIPRSLVPSDEYKVNRGDILIAMSGATTGKMGKYRGDTFCLLNQRVGKFVFRSGSSSAAYVSQLLLSGFLESRILAKAAGGAQPNISGKGIEGIEIPYPDAADQEKYGSAIKELLQVNSTRRGLVEKYQHLKSALSSDLLSGRKRVSV